MTRKEINEIRNLYTQEECNIARVVGCYVDGDKNKVTKIDEMFLNLPEEEQHKYFEIFRKTLSGTPGKNLVDMEFTEEACAEGGTRDDLQKLVMSELKDEDLLDEFYNKVIASYNYVGNYLILLIYQAYDVPMVTEDNIEMDDASDEVYQYILCSICPVKLSKPGLSYDEIQNSFHNMDRSYMVDLTETGFLFPAFTDRSSDVDRILLYSKSAEEFQDGFINSVLNCRIPLPAVSQKETFQTLVEETLEEACDFETVTTIHENLNALIKEKKSDPEPVVLEKEDVKRLFEESGVKQERLQNFDARFDKVAGEEGKLLATNVAPPKKFEVKTPDVVVKFNSEKTDLVETRVIDGQKCLVIRIDEGLEVNGIAVPKA